MYDDDGYSPHSQIAPGVPEHAEAPIHNIEAEAALLGALMIDNNLIELVSGKILIDDFAEPAHQAIYSVIIRTRQRGKAANPVTLRPLLVSEQALDELGGVSYLARLTGSGAAIIGALDFADQIAELGAARRMRRALHDGIARLENDLVDASPMEIAASVEASLWDAAKKSTPIRSRSATDVVDAVIARAEELTERGISPGVRNILVPEIHELVGEFLPQRYHVIGGRPGMGKSTLLQSVFWGLALNDVACEYFHAEMSDIAQDLRSAADLALHFGYDLPHDRLEKGQLSPQQIAYLEKIRERAKLLPVNFTSVGRIDINELKGRAARAKAQWARKGKELKVIGIDYIQILNATRDGKLIEDETTKVTLISSRLLDIAKDLDVTVVALSQLSRDVDKRTDKRPQISDLRQSAALENDADSVTMVFREEYYLSKERAGVAPKDMEDWEKAWQMSREKIDLLTRKNRHGSEGDRTCRFFGANYAVRGKTYDRYALDQHDFDYEPD